MAWINTSPCQLLIHLEFRPGRLEGCQGVLTKHVPFHIDPLIGQFT